MKRILSLIGVVLVMGCGPEGPPDDGPYEIYHENGQLMMKGTFKDGELDGPVESYYDNGELSYKGTYKDDEECGEWIEDGETVTYDPC
jgi:antitoxin component YwqK of YwqJK toxin-antitoxin module